MKKFKLVLVKCVTLEREFLGYYEIPIKKKAPEDLDDVEIARAAGEARFGRNGYFVGAERV